MATVKVTLDTRSTSKTTDNKYPLVLRLGHKSKTRDINLNHRLLINQFNETTCTITGIQNAVRHSKKVQKKRGDIDLWLDENKGDIKLWPISQLKDTIEKKFFGKQSDLTILTHAATVLKGYFLEGRYSTVSSYEDALKILVKYQMKRAKQNDKVLIKTLFNTNVDKEDENFFAVLPKYQDYDLPIKAFNNVYVREFKAYLATRTKSKNSISIYFRSLNVILNDAEKTYGELKGHKPLDGVKKGSYHNDPVVLTLEEIDLIRKAKVKKGTTAYHMRNYFLFMFNNMGMNFMDVAVAKVSQFDGERFKYTREKTKNQGDHFSIKQSEENLKIIRQYLKVQKKADDYLFPIIPADTPPERVFKVKQNESRKFNTAMKKIARDLGIEKSITTYTARDTWTNIGLEMGIDIRKISSALGHSSVQITEKHYSQSIKDSLLDQINRQITLGPK